MAVEPLLHYHFVQALRSFSRDVHTCRLACRRPKYLPIKIIRLGDAPSATGCYLSGLGKERIRLLGRSPSPEKGHYGCRILELSERVDGVCTSQSLIGELLRTPS